MNIKIRLSFKKKIFDNNKVFINIIIKDNITLKFNDNSIYQSQNIKSKEIKEISLLEDFYGQLSSIEISITKDKIRLDYLFLPISIRNNILYKKKFNVFK